MRQIVFDILGPILLMMSLGALVYRRFKIDLPTLAKLNIYLFVPAFIFDKVSTSTLDWTKMGGIVAVCLLQVLMLAAMVAIVGILLRIPRKTLAAVAMAVMFYNSGNYGLPLAKLAYNDRGAEVQAFVLMTQNLLTFTVGLALAASAHHEGLAKGFATFLKLPMLPTLLAALLCRWYLTGHPDRHLPIAISQTAHFLAAGLIPLAMVTLGAQLASRPRWPRWKPVSLVLFLRLILGPVQMLVMLYGLHWLAPHLGAFGQAMDLWPWPAELLILTASVPTAVNTLLLTMELEGDASLAADCVFWTTLLSAITITAWLLVIRRLFAG